MIGNTKQKDSARYEGPGIARTDWRFWDFIESRFKRKKATSVTLAVPRDEGSTCLAACFVLNLGASPQRLFAECALTKEGGLASALQREAQY